MDTERSRGDGRPSRRRGEGRPEREEWRGRRPPRPGRAAPREGASREWPSLPRRVIRGLLQQPPGLGLRLLQGRDGPVELALVDRLEDPAHGRTRGHAEGDQVAAAQQRRGRPHGHLELQDPLAKPLHGHRLEPPGAPAQAVGPGHAVEQVRLALASQAADRAVPHPIPLLVQLSRLQMVAHERRHLTAHVVAEQGVDVPAVEEGQGGRDPRLLVAGGADAAILGLRGRGLAEVVAKRGQHHRESSGPVLGEALDETCSLVDHLQGVRPHVAFRMPFRVLGSRGQRDQLRGDGLQHPPLRQEGEATGRPGTFQEQLLHLAEDPFGGKLDERHHRAEGGGGGVDRQLEAGRELYRPESAQRILAERVGANPPQNPDSGSRRPPWGSTSSSRSGSYISALIVKSRRRAASATVRSGSPTTAMPLWPGPTFESRRGSETSTAPGTPGRPDSLKTVKAWPAASTLPTVLSTPASRSAGRPKTSTSKSARGRSRSASRTAPPTT